MKFLTGLILSLLTRLLLSLRYRVEIKGLEKIRKNGKKGILFLPDHPSVFVDPSLVTSILFPRFSARPVAVDFMYYKPVIHFFMKLLRAIPLPSFSSSSNSHKVRKMRLQLDLIAEGLNHGENFIFYPSGKVKSTPFEQVGGNSGLSEILKKSGEVEIVLVRTKGLWGSRFSKAFSDKTPAIDSVLWQGLKITLANLIFFNPRRSIEIVFEAVGKDFPYNGSRSDINQYLESWYNEKGEGEPLKLVPYYRFLKKLEWKEEEKKPVENRPNLPIPDSVREKVYKRLHQLFGMSIDKIEEGMSLTSDLGSDSLDIAELTLFLDEEFDVKNVVPENLILVKDVLEFAAKEADQKTRKEQSAEKANWSGSFEEKKRVYLGGGATVLETFLKKVDENPSRKVVGDSSSGILSYRDLKMRILLLSRQFESLPGKEVGVLLPASVAAFVVVLALQAAGKVPVMLNWTLGRRHIESVVQSAKIEVSITSWAFIDKLPHVDLGPISDQLIQLEDLRSKFSLFQKLRAMFLARLKSKTLLKKWIKSAPKEGDRAVILFTSGSEGNPKGVPLTHKNVLSNIRALAESRKLFESDILISILPPFHSFGFTVCSMACPLLGMRVAHYPNPNDGPQIAHGVAFWQGTLLCGAPFFLKNILKAGSKNLFSTLRLIVSGAEKPTQDFFEIVKDLGFEDKVAQGYGITECSPILTLNRDEDPHVGVGRAVEGVEIKIVHPETFAPIRKGSTGLILAKGPGVFSGYLSSTSSPFHLDEEGSWYITGDLGTLAPSGILTISGRLKRFVKIGGEMVSLGTLEEVLNESYHAKLPSGKQDRSAFVVISEGEGEGKPRLILFTTESLSLAEANEILRSSGLGLLIKIHQVIQVDEIPILGTGKVNYRELQTKIVNRIDG